jgi:hypothetical protein
MEFVGVPINLINEEVPELAVREILEDNMIQGKAPEMADPTTRISYQKQRAE